MDCLKTTQSRNAFAARRGMLSALWLWSLAAAGDGGSCSLLSHHGPSPRQLGEFTGLPFVLILSFSSQCLTLQLHKQRLVDLPLVVRREHPKTAVLADRNRPQSSPRMQCPCETGMGSSRGLETQMFRLGARSAAGQTARQARLVRRDDREATQKACRLCQPLFPGTGLPCRRPSTTGELPTVFPAGRDGSTSVGVVCVCVCV